MSRPTRRKPVLPLYEAAWQLAPASERLEAMRRRAEPQPALPKGTPGSKGDALISIVEAFQAGLVKMIDPREPTPEMKKLLTRKLAEGNLQAFGFMTKPDLAREQQTIPPHFFKGHPRIDWHSNAMDNLQHRFEIIEVARFKQDQRSISRDGNKTQRGRPSVDEEITTVICELKKKRAFETLSEKQRVALVQFEARKRYLKLFPKPTQPSATKVREMLALKGV